MEPNWDIANMQKSTAMLQSLIGIVFKSITGSSLVVRYSFEFLEVDYFETESSLFVWM